ncbi:MAG: hypothetical protein ABI306_04630, partial [Caulobacteraceae bacterium]
APGSATYTVTSSANQTVDDIQTWANATLAIGAGTFAATNASGPGINAGTIAVADGATFSAGGTLANAGVLELLGTSKGADLRIGAAGLVLTGGGEVVLADSLAAPFQPCPPKYSIDKVIGPSGATFTNVDNTIVGSGYIGPAANATFGLVNEAKGVIDASLDTDLLLISLGTIVNGGLLEATGAGGLYIVSSTIDNASGGVIGADGGTVYSSYSSFIGGTFVSSGRGRFYFDHGPSVLDGATVGVLTNRASVFVSDGATLTLEGAIDNLGQIAVAVPTSSRSSTLIVGAAGATLTGGGQILLQGTGFDTQITAAVAGAMLVNVDNTISGQGRIGAGALKLVNQAGGVIDANGVIGVDQFGVLTLDTGVNTIANAGLIEAGPLGFCIIAGALENTGVLEAAGGTLIVGGPVIGKGSATIAGGRLDFIAAFSQAVAFTTGTGVLELGRSQDYAGAISGFSKSGGAALDLRDIGFVNSTEATFSGAASGGTLTVTDGTHTAHIALTGDYRGSTFVASSDGHGGTNVVDPSEASSAHRFIAAAAGLGAGVGADVSVIRDAWRTRPPMLARPEIAAA